MLRIFKKTARRDISGVRILTIIARVVVYNDVCWKVTLEMFAVVGE